MGKIIKLYLFLFLLISFHGCNREDLSWQGQTVTNPTEVIFSSEVRMNSYTKASGDSWDTNDSIGIYMIHTPIGQSETEILTENVSYVTTGDGYFYATSSSQVVKLPEEDFRVGFVAYYPFLYPLENGLYPMDLTDQSKQEKLDFLYTNTPEETNSNNPQVKLSFSHKLVKLNFNISGNFLAGALEVRINGLPVKGDFDLLQGKLEVDKNSVEGLDIKLTHTGNNTAKGEAIVFPGLAGDNVVVVFSLPNSSYKWNIPADIVFESGKSYTYDIVLKSKEPEVKPNYGWFETPAFTDIDNAIFISHDLPDMPGIRNYSMLYDTKYKISYWVAYPMHEIYLGSADRTNAWAYDPKISTSFQPVLFSGFENGTTNNRGHQLASADRTYSSAGNKTTFYFTNMTPQNGPLNSGVWATLEGKVRTWTKQCDTLYVVTGAMITTATDREITYIKDNNKNDVAKPKYYFKVLAKKTGEQYYTVGFRMNNEKPDNSNPNYYRTTVKELEEETGFTFFPAVSEEIKSIIQENQWQ